MLLDDEIAAFSSLIPYSKGTDTSWAMCSGSHNNRYTNQYTYIILGYLLYLLRILYFKKTKTRLPK